MRICLVQLAKSPEYDPVKTRMRPALSEAQAVSLHKNLLTHLVQEFSQLDKSEQLEHQLWSSRGGEFIHGLCLKHGLAHYEQEGGGLGERLSYASKVALQNFDAVVLIGSDCPFLSCDIMRRVAKELQHHDGVIIPANDGGYVLLAAKRYAPDIFEGVDWGTGRVFEQTQKRLRMAKLDFLVLDSLDDIDRPEDLELLQSDSRLQHLVPI